MKNYNYFLSTFLLILTISIFTATKVSATVGGETLIYDFKYSPADESVYYIRIDGGGRGCPPELMKVSLNSEKTTVVFSCDKAEKLQSEQVGIEIDKITKDFKFLTPLSLKANDVSIDVKFIKVETYGSESNEILMRHFIAELYQNGKKIKEFPITGCSLDQPFTFQGYSIPGFDKKMIILMSAKGNCAEGGYISETLYVVGGVDNLDKTQVGNFFKGPTPLLPNEGNLVVYESDKSLTTNNGSKDGSVISASTSLTDGAIQQNNQPSVDVEKPARESFFIRLIQWFKNLFQR